MNSVIYIDILTRRYCMNRTIQSKSKLLILLVHNYMRLFAFHHNLIPSLTVHRVMYDASLENKRILCELPLQSCKTCF